MSHNVGKAEKHCSGSKLLLLKSTDYDLLYPELDFPYLLLSHDKTDIMA
jgi:hypothetical protein